MMRLELKLKACLLGLILLLVASPFASASTLTTDEFETAMIGNTKVLMRQTDEYGEQASIFAIMLVGHGQQEPNMKRTVPMWPSILHSATPLKMETR